MRHRQAGVCTSTRPRTRARPPGGARTRARRPSMVCNRWQARTSSFARPGGGGRGVVGRHGTAHAPDAAHGPRPLADRTPVDMRESAWVRRPVMRCWWGQSTPDVAPEVARASGVARRLPLVPSRLARHRPDASPWGAPGDTVPTPAGVEQRGRGDAVTPLACYRQPVSRSSVMGAFSSCPLHFISS